MIGMGLNVNENVMLDLRNTRVKKLVWKNGQEHWA